MSVAANQDSSGVAAPKVLIIMPARNEAARIEPLVRELRERIPRSRILVVDDESSDDTSKVAAAAGATVARLPFNLGYGGALQTGYKFAIAQDFDFVVQMDADGQHRPADVPALLDRVMAGSCDLAVGSRFAKERTGNAREQESPYQMGTIRSIGRRMLCLFARLGGLRITDPTSGFQALNRRTLRLYASSWYPTDYPDVDVLLLAHRSGLRIAEEPVDAALRMDARVLRLPDASLAVGCERSAEIESERRGRAGPLNPPEEGELS
jgi:glycosyltransferase involved in cell wall biosynthesis